jgi:predicted aspartyl protease
LKKDLQMKQFLLLCVVLVGFADAPYAASTGAVSILVSVHNGAVLVPVSINGAPLNFLLDTGSERSAVGNGIIERLKLEEKGEDKALGNYSLRSMGSVEIRSIQIADVELNSQVLAVVDLTPLSRAAGVPIDGVLGNDVLRRSPFKLNYSKQTMTLGPLLQLGALGVPVRLKRVRDQLFVPVTLVSLRRELLVDTGTNSTNLSWGTWQQLSKMWKPKSVIEGIVSSEGSTAFLACLDSARIGNIEVKDQAMRVQNSMSTGIFAEPGFGGILGADFWSQFEVTFDLSRNMLYVKPDPDFEADPYKYVTIGIQFAKDSSGVFTVVSVWKNSPAAEAGIGPGDRISSVDGQSVTALTTGQFSKKLHAKTGTSIKLTLDRPIGPVVITVKTRKLLC